MHLIENILRSIIYIMESTTQPYNVMLLFTGRPGFCPEVVLFNKEKRNYAGLCMHAWICRSVHIFIYLLPYTSLAVACARLSINKFIWS